MTRIARQSASVAWRFRFPLLALVIVLSAAAIAALRTLGVSNSLENWYPQNDPALADYREFQATYGSDEIVVVAVTGNEPFDTEEGRLLVGDLTDRLLDVEGVATVTSLVTVPESLGEARGRLLGPDGHTTALVVQTMTGPEAEARRHRMLLDIRAAMDAFGLDSHLGGYGVVFDGLNEASTSGAASLIATAHAVMAGLLLLLFRRFRPVLLTIAAVSIAVAWTMGLYAATGHQLNMVTMVLPTLVLVIGIADCLHILRSVAAQDHAKPQKDRVIDGLSYVIGPCFLMTVTTAAGFLGLTASGLPVVQQLGWFGAAGVIAAFLVSVIVLTAGLSWSAFEPRSVSTRLDHLAILLCEFGMRRPKRVVALFAVLSVVAICGVVMIESDTDSIGYMKPTHVIRQDSDFIERELGPYVPIEFTITAEQSVFTAEHLDAIWAWQQQAARLPGIGWSWSLINALNVRREERPSGIGIEALETRLDRINRFSPAIVAGMLRGDEQLRVSFGAPIMSARSVRAMIRDIEAAAGLPATLTLRPAGYSPLYTRIVDEIVDSQLRGFGSAIVMIVVLIGLAMRSWRRTLLALPANGLPVLFALGLMGLTGIPLDVASATIASVILGLVVDDTVHLLRPGTDPGIRASLEQAASKAGGTLLMTTLVLASGFLVLGLAEIRSIAWFGVLTSFSVSIAILADLVLLPALASLRQSP